MCPECGAKSVMDRRALIRPFLVWAGVTILYVGGILWAAQHIERIPTWVLSTSALWFIPFLVTGIWFVRRTLRVPLRLVESRGAK